MWRCVTTLCCILAQRRHHKARCHEDASHVQSSRLGVACPQQQQQSPCCSGGRTELCQLLANPRSCGRDKSSTQNQRSEGLPLHVPSLHQPVGQVAKLAICWYAHWIPAVFTLHTLGPKFQQSRLGGLKQPVWQRVSVSAQSRGCTRVQTCANRRERVVGIAYLLRNHSKNWVLQHASHMQLTPYDSLYSTSKSLSYFSL
jgi:hypothetical protein